MFGTYELTKRKFAQAQVGIRYCCLSGRLCQRERSSMELHVTNYRRCAMQDIDTTQLQVGSLLAAGGVAGISFW